MRRLFIIALVLLAGLAYAGDSTDIVRSFHLDYSGKPDVNHGGTATMAIHFDSAVAGTYTTEVGSYVMTVHGSPTRVTDGTWPAGLSGSQGYSWTFDGSTDYLSRADDGTFDPAGDFSVRCVVTADNISSSNYIIGKYNTSSNQRGWTVYKSNDALRIIISDDGTSDGGHLTTVSKASVFAVNRPLFFTITYDYISDGSSVVNIYVDNASTETNSSVDGPVYNNTASLEIGSVNDGNAKWSGTMADCAFYDGVVLTEADHDFSFAQWQGRIAASDNALTITSAAPPAIIVAPPDSGTEPFIVDQPANSFSVGSPASGSGGGYGAGAISNLAQRRSLETWAAGAPTGWTEGITSTGDCAQQTTRRAHGGSSARCTLADADDAVTLTSACATVTGSTAYYGSAWARLESGTGLLDINVIEDDSVDCSSPTTTTAIVDDAIPTSTWARQSGTVTTQAGTIRAQIQISLPATAAQALDIDAIQLQLASTDTDAFCSGDTDAAAVCNLADITDANPKPIITSGTWQFEATVRSPIDGAAATPVRYIMYVPETAGDNNRIIMQWDSDTLTCTVFDSAGSDHVSTVAAAGNADTDYQVMMAKVCGNADCRVVCCWEGTCDATPATGAITDGVGSEVIYGSDGTTGGDIWVQNQQWLRRYRP